MGATGEASNRADPVDTRRTLRTDNPQDPAREHRRSPDGYTLDQFSVFVAIIEEGSFIAAARRMNRAQSAITYAIHRLEEQSGVLLFDRSIYRPALTEAGKALLPYARRILADTDDWRCHACAMAQAQEATLVLAVAAAAPRALLAGALADFHAAFPLVEMSVQAGGYATAARAVHAREADLGLLMDVAGVAAGLERRVCMMVDLIVVAAPNHPLVLEPEHFPAELLSDHTQLMLGNGPHADAGAAAGKRWMVSDMSTKLDMIAGGIGWGLLPRQRVADLLAAGTLVELQPDRWDGSDTMPAFPIVIAHRSDAALGPAGQWLVDRFAAGS